MFLQQEHEDIIHQRNIYSFLDINNKTNIEISYNKKIEFLAKRALEYGYVIDKSLNPEKIIDDLFKEFENSTINFKLKTAELEEDIDFQFESNLNDKILILDQLGFIDLLKTKNPNISGNKISKLLSSILEEKQASITPLINRLIQPNQEMDNKHPYYSIQSKNRVKEFLKHLGFQFKDKFNSI
jgi:hypothetical protein